MKLRTYSFRFLILSGLLFSLIGCASTNVIYVKKGFTNEEFKRDRYQCIQESRTSWGGGGTGGRGLAMIAISASIAQNQSNELFNMCMDVRGYTALGSFNEMKEYVNEKSER